MSNLESEIRRRLDLLRQSEYPVDRLEPARAKIGISQDQDPCFEQTSSIPGMVEQNLNAILNNWVRSEIGDNEALTKLFPLAVRFRYGDTELTELLTTEELANLPLAKLVTDAWFAVVLQSPDSIRRKFLTDYEAITDEHYLGMTSAEFANKFGTKGGMDHSL